MKGEEHIDIEEMERLRICTSNLQLMDKHIKRLEKYALTVNDVLNLESLSPMCKLNTITRLTETIKEFI